MLIHILDAGAGACHCGRGLQPDRRRPPKGSSGTACQSSCCRCCRCRSTSNRWSCCEHAFDLQERAAGAGGGKTGKCLMQLTPVTLARFPVLLGVRVLLALDANVAEIIAGLVVIGVGGITLLRAEVAASLSPGSTAGITFGFLGGIWAAIAAMPGRLFSFFCWQRDCAERLFTKEASLYLVVSVGLLGNSSDRQPPVQSA